MSKGVSLNICHTLLCISSTFIPYTSRYLEVAVCCSHHVVLCPAGKNPLGRQHVVVCYIAEWANWRQGLGKFTVGDIDPTLCTHLVYAFAVLNMATDSIEPAEPEYDLDDNDRTGWCMLNTVWIVSRVIVSQVQEVQCRTADCDTVLGFHWAWSVPLVRLCLMFGPVVAISLFVELLNVGMPKTHSIS